MIRAEVILGWPVKHLKPIAWASVVGTLTLVANVLWQPSVQPLYPAELADEAQDNVSAGGMIQEESMDFIFRPLFLSARKPVASADQPEPDKVVQDVLPDVESDALDDYALLGVFSSESHSGVILLEEQKERMRLYVGESLHGWQLESTGLRSALFRSPNGDQITLELALASTLPVPSSPRASEDVTFGATSGAMASDIENLSDGSAEAQTEQQRQTASAQPIRPTFESIAQRKRAKLAESMQQKSTDP